MWFVLATLSAGGCTPQAVQAPGAAGRPEDPLPVTFAVEVASGRFACDVYLPPGAGEAPLVVVAHGFARSKSNMADWGRHLAGHGFVLAVPTLPAWSDHARNGRAVNELMAWLAAQPQVGGRIHAQPVGLVGFSAGGLATLLAAADNPEVRVWVGLDPVDRGGLGAGAAGRMARPTLILRAQPHACNAYGNAANLCNALGGEHTCLLVTGATHTDPEWPTDSLARWACGPSSDQRRTVFVDYTVAALRGALLHDAAAADVLNRARQDARVTVLPCGAP